VRLDDDSELVQHEAIRETSYCGRKEEVAQGLGNVSLCLSTICN
jgi:hypothetical protein